MTLNEFRALNNMQKPLEAFQGDIFETQADHIAFAVHYPNNKGESDNSAGGFSSKVNEFGWSDIGQIVFKKGVPVTRKIKGKYFHALPVHCNDEGGWDEAPILIEKCLNKLPVDSTEVIAVILMGGGKSGEKYKASINNIEGMIRSFKTVVLYVYDEWMLNLLLGTGVVTCGTTIGVPLWSLPRVYKYREMINKDVRTLAHLGQ